MELTKQDLEAVLARQADRVAQESEERMQRYIGGLSENFEHKIDAVMEYVKDIPALKQDVSILQKNVSVLQQDVSVLKTVTSEMKPTLDATFEAVGTVVEDTVSTKEAVKDHEQRLVRIEAR